MEAVREGWREGEEGMKGGSEGGRERRSDRQTNSSKSVSAPLPHHMMGKYSSIIDKNMMYVISEAIMNSLFSANISSRNSSPWHFCLLLVIAIPRF